VFPPVKVSKLLSLVKAKYPVDVALPENLKAFGKVVPSIGYAFTAGPAIVELSSTILAVVLLADEAATKTAKLPAVKDWAFAVIIEMKTPRMTIVFFILF
jgi:hypothetical protein